MRIQLMTALWSMLLLDVWKMIYVTSPPHYITMRVIAPVPSLFAPGPIRSPERIGQ